MASKLPNYLRTYRKRTYLSQDEVAFLLGCRTGMKVYRYERFLREPCLKTVLGYELLFGSQAQELFAGIFQKVERNTQKRARLLVQRLTKNGAQSGRIKARKLEALRAILSGPEPEPVKKP